MAQKSIKNTFTKVITTSVYIQYIGVEELSFVRIKLCTILFFNAMQ